MDFSGIFRNKWFLYGGGIVCLFVLVAILRGNNQAVISTASGVAPPTDAQVQAQTTLALAQIDSATRASETNAQVAAQQLQYQTALQEKGVDAAVAKYSIDAQTQAQSKQIDAQIFASNMQYNQSMSAAELNASVARYTIDAQDRSEARQIQAQLVSDERSQNLQASIAKWTLDQALATQASNESFQLAYAAQANASADHQAEIVAAVTRASIDAQTNLGIASLAAQTAQVASYAGSQVMINDSNNAAQVAIVSKQTSAQKHQSTMGLLGSVVGGVAAIFSDRRLKRDITFLGYDLDGVARYSYRYVDDDSWQVGVMADEVSERARGRRVGGYDTVCYRLLADAA